MIQPSLLVNCSSTVLCLRMLSPKSINHRYLRGFLHFTHTDLCSLCSFLVYVNHPKPKPESGSASALKHLSPSQLRKTKETTVVFSSVRVIFRHVKSCQCFRVSGFRNFGEIWSLSMFSHPRLLKCCQAQISPKLLKLEMRKHWQGSNFPKIWAIMAPALPIDARILGILGKFDPCQCARFRLQEFWGNLILVDVFASEVAQIPWSAGSAGSWAGGVSTHTYIYIYTHMHLHICMCIHLHMSIHTYIHTYMHTCTYTSM